MSYYDLSNLSQEELIAQFYIERRNSGAVLTYHEYRVIESWLEAAENDSQLILYLLSEELDRDEKLERNPKRNLKALRKTLLTKIKKAKTEI